MEKASGGCRRIWPVEDRNRRAEARINSIHLDSITIDVGLSVKSEKISRDATQVVAIMIAENQSGVTCATCGT